MLTCALLSSALVRPKLMSVRLLQHKSNQSFCLWTFISCVQSNLFTKSLDTTSLSPQQHTCWELFHWSLYKMCLLQQQLGYMSTKRWNQWWCKLVWFYMYSGTCLLWSLCNAATCLYQPLILLRISSNVWYSTSLKQPPVYNSQKVSPQW